jgi:amidase
MASFKEYENYDAVGLADLVKSSDVKPVELLEAALERYSSRNPRYNAVNRLMEAEARSAVDKPASVGSLQGVPFLLKDLNLLFKGVTTGNGSRYWAKGIADHDWELTRRYKAAGLTIFGKTNTPEMGINTTTEPREFGATRNPWNPLYSSGGSSGGAAAAVASRMVPAAHATDGGGSIRIPASFCGLVGLKPTRGRISFAPDVGEGWAGLGAPHVVSRTVRDSAALLDVAAGPGIGDPYFAAHPSTSFLLESARPVGRLRIAYSTLTPGGTAVHDDCRRAVEKTASLCDALGHEVCEAAPEISCHDLENAVVTIIGANLWAALQARAVAMQQAVQPGDVENITWLWAQLGRSKGAADYVKASQVIHAVGRQLAGFLEEKFDLILTPTVPHLPYKVGVRDTMSEDLEDYLAKLLSTIAFTAQYNASGQPAISLPMHWSDDGLPIGVQFAAKYGDEATLFRIASQLESAQPWRDRIAKSL